MQQLNRVGPRAPEPGGVMRRFRRNLRVLERKTARSLASQTECCGVTMAQCHLLLEVAERGATNITELSDALALDKSTLSRTVDSLWNAGLLNRRAAPSNRRRQVIDLTDKGREKTDAIDRLCDDSVARLFHHIPRNKRIQVCDVVAVLAEAMRKNRECKADPCCRPAYAAGKARKKALRPATDEASSRLTSQPMFFSRSPSVSYEKSLWKSASPDRARE